MRHDNRKRKEEDRKNDLSIINQSLLEKLEEMLYFYNTKTNHVKWFGNVKKITGYSVDKIAKNGLEDYITKIQKVDRKKHHDALEKALLALHHQQPSALKVVFGCGGDRDKGKRPLMAKVAQQYCQQVYITDDNPRTEDNQQILADIAQGFSAEYVTSQVTMIADREQAIKQAMADLKAGECLLIAGKGHETYQEIQHQRFHFSDTEKVEQFKGLIA